MPGSKEFQSKFEQFRQLQVKAKKISEKCSVLAEISSTPAAGCFGFFHKTVPFLATLRTDTHTIAMVAYALDEKNNALLIAYLQEARSKKHALLTPEEFMEFKIHTLVGCYLSQWYMHKAEKPFASLFEEDLKALSLDVFSDEQYNNYLTAFSDFCTFIYKNQSDKTYTDLNEYLNVTKSIQLEIHNARHFKIKRPISVAVDAGDESLHHFVG